MFFLQIRKSNFKRIWWLKTGGFLREFDWITCKSGWITNRHWREGPVPGTVRWWWFHPCWAFWSFHEFQCLSCKLVSVLDHISIPKNPAWSLLHDVIWLPPWLGNKHSTARMDGILAFRIVMDEEILDPNGGQSWCDTFCWVFLGWLLGGSSQLVSGYNNHG